MISPYFSLFRPGPSEEVLLQRHASPAAPAPEKSLGFPSSPGGIELWDHGDLCGATLWWTNIAMENGYL